MPKTVRYHTLCKLSEESESDNEIILETNINTELHILQKGNQTVISFPFGNKVDIINGVIYVNPA